MISEVTVDELVRAGIGEDGLEVQAARDFDHVTAMLDDTFRRITE
ncbi:hypothetical protein [Nonomuraea sp. B19D2]